MNRTDSLRNGNIPEISVPTLKAEVKLSGIGDKPVILNSEGGSQSADTGILLMRETEEQIGLIRAMSEVIPDPGDARYVKHTLTDLLIQRIGQICRGYEDAGDCDMLRDDPVFKIPADRYPETGATSATIRKEVLKVTARGREMKTRIRIELSPAFPLKNLLIRSFGMSEMLQASG